MSQPAAGSPLTARLRAVRAWLVGLGADEHDPMPLHPAQARPAGGEVAAEDVAADPVELDPAELDPAGLNPAGLDPTQLLGAIEELERLKAACAGAQARLTVAFADARFVRARERGEDEASTRRAVGAEVALARRESPHRGDRQLGLARALVQELPETMRALTAGDIGEWAATVIAAETATLAVQDRRWVDRRLGPDLGHLSPRQLGRAARRVAAELDAASVVRRMERAVAGRTVSVRPAPDGMAYLTVLGPLPEAIGAYAALRAHAGSVLGGQRPDELPEGRGRGAIMADTALRLLSGRAVGKPQSVEVQLVMTDRSLLGVGDPARSADEPAYLLGMASVPAALARGWLRDGRARVFLRRLYTRPDGRDLVALDSRRRRFGGGLRRMLVLRDQTCRTPWCDAPVVDADHVERHADGGPTGVANSAGLCRRCNLTKETPGWRVDVVHTGLDPGGPSHTIEITTATGLTARSQAPPVLGWGWSPPTFEPSQAPDDGSPLERWLSSFLAA